MTRDQVQTRAVAMLMDLRDEGMRPEEVLNLTIMMLYHMIAGMSHDRAEARIALRVVSATMREGIDHLRPEHFGQADKAEEGVWQNAR